MPLEALHHTGTSPEVISIIEKIPSFPAPNPEMRDGRNVLGQTEEQFWDAVEAQEK